MLFSKRREDDWPPGFQKKKKEMKGFANRFRRKRRCFLFASQLRSLLKTW